MKLKEQKGTTGEKMSAVGTLIVMSRNFGGPHLCESHRHEAFREIERLAHEVGFTKTFFRLTERAARAELN